MENTICSSFLNRRNQHSTAYAFKDKKKWHKVSWSDLFKSTELVACGLKKLGLQEQDKVIILSDTRPEWLITDMAIMGIKAVTVPVYQSSRHEDLEYIANHSEACVIFCENKKQYKKWLKVSNNCPTVKHVVVFDAKNIEPNENMMSYQELQNLGQDYFHDHPNEFHQSCNQLKLKDPASIIYTSGTTGLPKGVLLTHEQFMNEMQTTFGEFEVGSNDRSLIFLPMAHVLGRVEALGAIYSGFSLYFATSIERIPENLLEVKPTVMVAVPRIFEKIYQKMQTKLASNSALKLMFKQAKATAYSWSKAKMNNQPVDPKTKVMYKLFYQLIFKKVNKAFGGNVRFVISGGAPFSEELGYFFLACKILVLEGYGLTETTAGVCVNRPEDFRFGSVGKPITNAEFKIAEDGEILIKSKNVMKEYYKNPEETEKAFQGDYFCTGDIGHLDDQGYLVITDRKKDLIKTSGGKYVAPQKIENLLKLSPYISQVHVYGDKQKYIVCLVTLNDENVLQFAKGIGLNTQELDELKQHSEIKKLINAEIKAVNKKLASYETIKRHSILSKDFTVESGELTPSLKIKRKVINEKYKDELNKLYDAS